MTGTPSRPSILFVTHCYAVELPQYATFLKYQLTSLEDYLWTWGENRLCDVLIDVWFWEGDEATKTTLYGWQGSLNLSWHSFLNVGSLGRRSIGRNISALRTRADYVFFTDVDHVFNSLLIDGIPIAFRSAGDHVAMISPGEVMIHKDWVTGDRYAESKDDRPRIDRFDFTPKVYDRAIGGVQIVRGDFARLHGYLSEDKKWQTIQAGKPFSDFKDDVAFRKFCEQNGGQKLLIFQACTD